MCLAAAIPAARAAPVSFDVVLAAQVISGQPAGLTALPGFPFQMALPLDSTALTPNLQNADPGTGLLNIALVLGTVTYARANFGPTVGITTHGAGQLTGLEFGSPAGGHRLFGITGQGWSYAETQQDGCASGVAPTGTNCIGDVGPQSAVLREVASSSPVPKPATLGVLASGLAWLLTLRWHACLSPAPAKF